MVHNIAGTARADDDEQAGDAGEQPGPFPQSGVFRSYQAGADDIKVCLVSRYILQPFDMIGLTDLHRKYHLDVFTQTEPQSVLSPEQ